MAVAVLFGSGKVSLKPFGVRGSNNEPVEGLITWTADNSTVHSYASNRKTFLRNTQGGTHVYLYSYGSQNLTGSRANLLFSSNSTSGYGIYINATDTTLLHISNSKKSPQ